MSGLPWIRLDVALPRNHKILTLLAARHYQAVTSYVFSLTYAGEQGTDGFIPREALPLIAGTRATAQQLVDVTLWAVDPGGWIIHGWADKQLTNSENEARSNRARMAAQVRWARDRA